MSEKIKRYDLEVYYNKYCCEDQIRDIESNRGCYCLSSDVSALESRLEEAEEFIEALCVVYECHEDNAYCSLGINNDLLKEVKAFLNKEKK